jgi:hypothetical protein
MPGGGAAEREAAGRVMGLCPQRAPGFEPLLDRGRKMCHLEPECEDVPPAMLGCYLGRLHYGIARGAMGSHSRPPNERVFYRKSARRNVNGLGGAKGGGHGIKSRESLKTLHPNSPSGKILANFTLSGHSRAGGWTDRLPSLRCEGCMQRVDAGAGLSEACM